MATARQLLIDAEVARAAELAGALRAYLDEAAKVCSAHGLTPSHYELLLQIRAQSNGSDETTLPDVSERLALAHGSAHDLALDAQRAGLLEQTAGAFADGAARLRLTSEGERELLRASEELRSEREKLVASFRDADARFRALAESLELHDGGW